MKRFELVDVKEEVIYEKLDNGLTIIFCPNKNANSYYITFTTMYGSKYHKFIPLGKKEYLTSPFGVAHFLEHKMFSQPDGTDAFDLFSSLGVNANAFTSLEQTTYLVSGSTKFKESLTHLINYVQTPYFTEESVLKEQGIIGQEIDMYLDNPNAVLHETSRYNTFISNPIKESIIGTKKDIASINKEILYDCYNTFYHPSNMIVVITGNFDENEALDIIKNNQKDYDKPKSLTYEILDEDDKVSKKEEIKKMLVSVPKMVYNIKIPLRAFNSLSKEEIVFNMQMIFKTLFEEKADFTYNLIEDDLIIKGFSLDYLYTESHFVVSIGTKTTKPKLIVDKISEYLKNITITTDEIKKYQKWLLSTELYLFENIENVNHFLLEMYLDYQKIIPSLNEIASKVTKKKLDDFIKKMNVNNYNVVIIEPK